MKVHLKKIVIKGSVLLLPFFCYYIVYDSYLMFMRSPNSEGYELFRIAYKSRKKTTHKKVIFGDSAAFRFYPSFSDYKGRSLYSLVGTGPASMVSVYVLMNNYIEANGSDGVEFYYIIHPLAFKQTLKTKFTYNQFIKPFYTFENMRYFSSSVNDTIRSAYHYWYAAQLPFIATSEWQPELTFTLEKGNEFSYAIAPLNIEYLKKIDSLTKSQHIKMHLLAPYMSDFFRNSDYSEIQKKIKENGLQDIFTGYFENIKYFPDSTFADHVHTKQLSKYNSDPMGIEDSSFVYHNPAAGPAL